MNFWNNYTWPRVAIAIKGNASIERILMLNFGSESMRFLMRLANATDIDESMPN